MQRLSSLARYYTHAQKSGRKAHAYNNSRARQCSCGLHKKRTTKHTSTLLSRSLSRCEESLDCINLCRAALAAARDTQTSLLPHTYNTTSPFPLLFIPGTSFTLCLQYNGKECESKVQGTEREETLLVAGDCSVRCTDWNDVEQNVFRQRTAGE